MGYTHYWNQVQEVDSAKFASFTKDAALIIKTADDAGIPIGNSGGQGLPEVTDSVIALNGFAQYGCESFVLELGEAFTVKSDGNWSDWIEGRNLYAETFGVEAEESEVF